MALAFNTSGGSWIWLWLALPFCAVSCKTNPAVVHDLSMRFTHPELYRTRHWFPRENALVEMQHRGLLKRGMHWGELMQLLGLPDHSEEFDGEVKCTYDQNHNLLSTEESILPPKELWIYGLKSSQLTVEFDRPGQTALSFRWSYDEGGPEDWVW